MSRKGRQMVEMKNGNLGILYSSAKLINGKVPVYPATKTTEIHGFKIIVETSETGVLCNPVNLKLIGFID